MITFHALAHPYVDYKQVRYNFGSSSYCALKPGSLQLHKQHKTQRCAGVITNNHGEKHIWLAGYKAGLKNDA
jgi:hypothetical protein